MFQFIGDILGIGLFFGLGSIMFYKPYHWHGFEGPRHHIEKRTRQTKRIGMTLMILSALMLVAFIADQLTKKHSFSP
jgi:hypothetical protein